jgi:hypothetical protein
MGNIMSRALVIVGYSLIMIVLMKVSAFEYAVLYGLAVIISYLSAKDQKDEKDI